MAIKEEDGEGEQHDQGEQDDWQFPSGQQKRAPRCHAWLSEAALFDVGRHLESEGLKCAVQVRVRSKSVCAGMLHRLLMLSITLLVPLFEILPLCYGAPRYNE